MKKFDFVKNYSIAKNKMYAVLEAWEENDECLKGFEDLVNEANEAIANLTETQKIGFTKEFIEFIHLLG